MVASGLENIWTLAILTTSSVPDRIVTSILSGSAVPTMNRLPATTRTAGRVVFCRLTFSMFVNVTCGNASGLIVSESVPKPPSSMKLVVKADGTSNVSSPEPVVILTVPTPLYVNVLPSITKFVGLMATVSFVGGVVATVVTVTVATLAIVPPFVLPEMSTLERVNEFRLETSTAEAAPLIFTS